MSGIRLSVKAIVIRDDDLLVLKMTALRAQASQITPLLEEFDEEVFRGFCRWEFFRLAAAA